MFYRFALYGFLKNLRFFEPFLILIFREHGLSFLQIGLLYTVRDVTTAVLEIPSGVYADTFGRKLSMLMSFGAYLISFVIFFLATNFYLAALAMLFFAWGEAFRSGTHKALILAHLRRSGQEALKVTYYGRTRAASQLGSAVNALLAAALVLFAGNYRYIFAAATIPYLINLFNLSTYPSELDEMNADQKRGTLGEQIKETSSVFGAIFKDQNALPALLNSAGFTAFFKTVKDYLQPILNAFAVTLPVLIWLDDTRRAAIIIGLVYSLIYLSTSYASQHAAGFSHRFKNLAQAINLTFMAGAGFLLVAGIAAWQQMAVLSILLFLGLYILQNLRKPLTVAFISDQISHKIMASGLSAESQIATLFTAVLAPVLGFLADQFSMSVALVCFGGGMMVFWLLGRVADNKGESLASSG